MSAQTATTVTEAHEAPGNGDTNSATSKGSETDVASEPTTKLSKLEALQQSRQQRAEQRELQQLRERVKNATTADKELADLKALLTDIPGNLDKLGIKDARKFADTFYEKHKDAILDAELTKPDPDPNDDIRKELQELKKWRDEEAERRQKASQSALEAENARVEKARNDGNKRVVTNLASKTAQQYPIFAASGDEGFEMFMSVYDTWWKQASDAERQIAQQDDELSLAIIDQLENDLYEKHKNRYQSFSRIEKFRSLLPKEMIDDISKGNKRQRKVDEAPVRTIEPTTWDDEDELLEKAAAAMKARSNKKR